DHGRRLGDGDQLQVHRPHVVGRTGGRPVQDGHEGGARDDGAPADDVAAAGPAADHGRYGGTGAARRPDPKDHKEESRAGRSPNRPYTARTGLLNASATGSAPFSSNR